MSGSSGSRQRVRRGGWLIAVALVTLAVIAAVAMTRSPAAEGIPTDPANANPQGSRAVARVLERNGVSVSRIGNVEQLRDTSLNAATTLLISTPNALDRTTAQLVADRARGVGRLVLIRPSNLTLSHLGVPAQVGQTLRQPLRGDCARQGAGVAGAGVAGAGPAGAGPVGAAPGALPGSDQPDVENDWEIPNGGVLYRPAPTQPALTCLRGLLGQDAGAYLLLPATASRVETVLIGSPEILFNGSVGEDSQAAIALRTLGHHRRLAWFVPTAPAGTTPTDAVVPAWFQPAVAILAGACVGLMLWRGRRLGRLVVEPLPALVQATESTQALGRLYDRANEPDRTLHILRQATTQRLAHRLGLPAGSSPAEVAQAVARTAGADPSELTSLLQGPADPQAVASTQSKHLLSTARRLAQVEKTLEVEKAPRVEKASAVEKASKVETASKAVEKEVPTR